MHERKPTSITADDDVDRVNGNAHSQNEDSSGNPGETSSIILERIRKLLSERSGIFVHDDD
jgi:hypothetical protein